MAVTAAGGITTARAEADAAEGGPGLRTRKPGAASLRLACGCVLLVVLAGLVARRASAQEALEVTLSNAGFKPETIRLRKGDTTRLNLRTPDDEHCFAVDALRIERRVRPGRSTSLEITPDKAGSFPVYCCLEPENARLRGRLLVAE